MIFSHKTIVELFEQKGFSTHNEIEMFCLKHDFDIDLSEQVSVNKKITNMIKYVISEQISDDNLLEIAQDLALEIFSDDEMFKDSLALFGRNRVYKKELLKNHLLLDGFNVLKGGLLETIFSRSIGEQKNEVQSLLEKYKSIFADSLLHIQNAEKAFVKAEWGNAASNARKFIESLILDMSKYLNLDKKSNGENDSQNNMRQKLSLSNPPILTQSNKFYDKEGKGLYNGYYNYLSLVGAHAGPHPEKEDVLLIFQTVYPIALYQLNRFTKTII
ncbi:hypothetical protein [Bacillus sp. LBG-1-113]|uniref:hypothetical protein n=1 Tax=Bacillus sp. LBG-1-113 TaxID=2886094 RepID=UPI001E562966|nr:hypothetical protein [Bacillus sp. LBG-1-113]MCC2931626.1 hypothetical protein [Bacillus sp. LBG-1-113]